MPAVISTPNEGAAEHLPKKRAAELVALDDALKGLREIDPRKSQLVELRFFGGLSVEETAEVMKISPRTVMREWRVAKAWLDSEISGESSSTV